MSQVITNAFEQYWQSSLAAEQPVVLDEFILADIPNLDITAPIDPDTVLPPESQIVHRQSVDQRGRINNNAVAYTIVMDTTVGDFSFNAMYLRNKQNGVIGMIVYKGRETKLKTDQTTGQTGNSLVKSMLMGYDQAAEATLTNVDAGTWQIDYAARLRGQDEDLRQLASQLYGHHTFIGDGFKVVQQDGGHQVTQGVAIVGGLRIELKQPQVIYPGTKPIGVWVDVHRSGSLLSEHQNHFTIITSVADLTDHVDESGYPHYVAKLGTVQADGTVVDGRGSISTGTGAIPDTFAIWKRLMAEVGFDLIGQFGIQNTIKTTNQVLLSKDGSKVYGWLGTLPKDVPADATITNTGGIGATAWIDRSTALLSAQLKIKTPETFGGAPSPADSTAAFNASSGTPIQIPDEVYSANPLPLAVVGMVGRAKSKLKQIATTGNFISYRDPVGGRMSNLDIEANRVGNPTGEGHNIDVSGGSDVTFSDLNLSGGENKGFSLLAYANDPTPIQTGFIIKSIRGKFKRAAIDSNSGCVLVHRMRNSIIDGVIADGYAEFGAVELKDTVRLSIVNNVIANDSDTAMFFGSETTGNPSNNIISNVVAGQAWKSGIHIGKGLNNLFSNVMVDYSTSPAAITQMGGVSIDGGSANAVDNIFMTGPDNTKASTLTRFRGGATNNYMSAFAHYTASGVVSFEVGTTRNVVEIKHPGARSDIFAAGSTINDKTTVTGDSTGNVVLSPATGQWFGTLSGRYEWRHKDMVIPGGVLFSGDRFRMLSDTGASLVVGGATTAQLKLFTADGTYRTLSLGTAQAIRLDIGSSQYLQFGETALTPSQTNTYTLGSSSNAWAGGFTQTAFTVLSDERAKTPLADITDTMLDAWEEVEFGKYKLLDRIEAKGADGARWHFGVIAQRTVEAFAKHGLNAHHFAFLCYDKWDDQYIKVQTNEGELVTKTRMVEKPAMVTLVREALVDMTDEDGNVIGKRIVNEEYQIEKLKKFYLFNEDGTPRVDDNGVRVYMMAPELEEVLEEYTEAAPPEFVDVVEIPAGDRYGINYEEALILEAALQRRNCQRQKQINADILERIAALEA